MTNCPSVAAASPSSRSTDAPAWTSARRATRLASLARTHGAAPAWGPDKRLEHQRWIRLMAHDHALLRHLAERFERAEHAQERVTLLQLALDFHEMHALFEARWMPLPELAPARAILEDLAEQIECTVPASALHRARGLIWIEHLLGLMRQEETCHREQLPRSGPVAPWSPEFLGWRTALISATRAAL